MKLKNVKNKKCNVLSHTIHRKFGFVWTDGQIIYLTPLSPLEDYSSTVVTEVKSRSESSITLGQFKEVESVSWSDTTHPRSFLSVILKQESAMDYTQIQIWQMVHAYPKVELSLLLNQEFLHEPARYGCTVWDTSVKKLCLLMKKIACIYYYNDIELKFESKGKLEPNLGREEFRCACWSSDSKVLLVAFYMGIALYESDQQGVIILPFITVSLPGVITVTAVTGEAFMCSCELMLENLVTNAKGEPESLDQLASELPSCQGDCPIGDLNKFQVLLPQVPVAEDTSCLAIISESGRIISKVNLHNILVPNLLTWLPFRNWCLVGSTNSKQLSLISLTNNNLSRVNEINFPSNLRPRGIVVTGRTDDSIYMGTSDCSSYDHLFPVTSTGSSLQNLQLFHVPFEILLHKNLTMQGKAPLVSSPFSPSSVVAALPPKPHSPTIRRLGDSQGKHLTSPSGTNLDAALQKVVNMIIHKYETKDRLPSLPRESSKPDLLNVEVESESSHAHADCQLQSTESIRSRIPAAAYVYPTVKDIECVTVHCEVSNKLSKPNQFTKDIMLLPGGRLKLQTLLDTFTIYCAEILSGTKFVVVTHDDDGCLPIKFQNGEKVWVRAQSKCKPIL